jgi:hypothetical protein
MADMKSSTNTNAIFRTGSCGLEFMVRLLAERNSPAVVDADTIPDWTAQTDIQSIYLTG